MNVLVLSESSLRDWLRQQTRAPHERTDAMFGALINAGAAGVKHFLAAHALAAPAIAKRIYQQSDLPFATDFDPAPVTALLKHDLEALGATLPAPLPLEDLASAAECIGAAYTLAGSRLGAKVLAKQWRTPSSGESFSSAYLDQEGLFGDWRGFCSYLETLDTEVFNRDLILQGALAAFTHFQTAYTQVAGPRHDHV